MLNFLNSTLTLESGLPAQHEHAVVLIVAKLAAAEVGQT